MYVVELDIGQFKAGTTTAAFIEAVLVAAGAIEVIDDFELTLALVEVETGALARILAPHTLELKTGELRAPFM